MFRSALALAAIWVGFASLAYADPEPLKIVLGTGASLHEFVIPRPEGVMSLPCEREAILNLHCLRADGIREGAILDSLSTSILANGWTAAGDDRTSRPHLMAFRQANNDNACDHMLLITSATTATAPRPPLAQGQVEIMIAKTLDATCLFETLDKDRRF